VFSLPGFPETVSDPGKLEPNEERFKGSNQRGKVRRFSFLSAVSVFMYRICKQAYVYIFFICIQIGIRTYKWFAAKYTEKYSKKDRLSVMHTHLA